jgi:hypothetical protein
MSTPSSSLEALSSRPIPLRVRHGARDDRGEPAQSRRAAEHRRVLAGQPLAVRGKLYLKVNPLLREPLSVLAPHWIDLSARQAALPVGYGDPRGPRLLPRYALCQGLERAFPRLAR